MVSISTVDTETISQIHKHVACVQTDPSGLTADELPERAGLAVLCRTVGILLNDSARPWAKQM